MSDGVHLLVNFSYNLGNAMSLLVHMSKTVGFGGISIYEWIRYMASAFFGLSLLAIFMRNLYGTFSVASNSMFEGIWQGLNDPIDDDLDEEGVSSLDYDPIEQRRSVYAEHRRRFE